MASLTVRQLDEETKTRLRLRAAQNGRSMEDEVRTILRQAAAGRAAVRRSRPSGARRPPAPETGPSRMPADGRAPDAARVLLIIGGGIAAYKSLDLIRRLQERGAAVRCVMTERRAGSSSRRSRPARSRASGCSPTCSMPTASSTSVTSGWRAKPI